MSRPNGYLADDSRPRKSSWPPLAGALLVLVAGAALLIKAMLPVGTPQSTADIEARELTRLSRALRDAAPTIHERGLAPSPEVRGAACWWFLLDQGLMDMSQRRRLVSLNSLAGDRPAEKATVDATQCSYTAPRADELARLLAGPRCVLVTFNARNWGNYSQGVLVLWSDKLEPDWLTPALAAREWGITPEEWADPAGKLFGKKAPFQYTFE